MQPEQKPEEKVTLTVKNVPRPLADGLRRRAAENHRSLQGELMAILERAAHEANQLSAAEVYERVRRRGLTTPSESAAIVRELRDSR